MALREYANNIKRSYIDACNAVLARGGTVSSGMPISDLSSAILNIPHDQTLAYYKQENTKHIITVPRNSEPYARIVKIGGMTYKSANYFDKSKVTNSDIPITVTDTGFSFTNTVADKQPTPIGYLKNLAPELKVGDVVTFYSNVVNASIDKGYGFLYITEAKVDWLGGNFITITEAHLSGMVYAYGALNKVCEYKNLIITKEENAPYSPYFEGLRDTKVTELVSEGANHLPFPYKESSLTEAGLTYHIREDGGIEVSGTPTGYSDMMLAENLPISYLPTVFTMSQQGNPINMAIDFSIKDINYGVLYSASIHNDKVQDVDLSKYPTAKFFTATLKRRSINVVCSGIVYPMINYGTTAKPYKQYVGTLDTLPISAELRAFLADKGYGRGIEGYYGYIDLKEKLFYPPRTYRKVFDGTEPWIANGTEGNDAVCYNLILLPAINAPAGVWRSSDIAEDGIVTYYDVKSGTDVYLRNTGVALMDDRINIYDPNYNTTDVSLWKAHLADLYAQGKPLIAEYVTEDVPKPIDISAYLIDDLIKVEGDGTITAISEYNYDMPSEVNYIINTVGG